MKPNGNRKLVLHRETIQVLRPDALEDVNGGSLVSEGVKASLRYSAKASGWVTNNVCPTVIVESVMESARRTFGGGGNK